MAALTGLPASVTPGTPSAAVTLNKADLITALNIVDVYWSVSSNWDRAVFCYQDATNVQSTFLTFYGANTANILVSSHAKANSWTCHEVIIFDLEGGEFVVPRASFVTPSEFDFSVV
jgi:hypothetical protein